MQLARSNRTFMELKFILIIRLVEMLSSSNRTFMELKLSQKAISCKCGKF